MNERKEASIRATSTAMVRRILPFLAKVEDGAHVRSILIGELEQHEQTSQANANFRALCLMVTYGGIIGALLGAGAMLLAS